MASRAFGTYPLGNEIDPGREDQALPKFFESSNLTLGETVSQGGVRIKPA
jgi:hypothetical protein